MNPLTIAAAVGIAAGIAGYLVGYLVGNRHAWRLARYWSHEYGRLPLDSTLYEPRRRARRRARHRHPADNGQRRRRTDRAYTVLGVALIGLVVTAGAVTEALASALEALI